MKLFFECPNLCHQTTPEVLCSDQGFMSWWDRHPWLISGIRELVGLPSMARHLTDTNMPHAQVCTLIRIHISLSKSSPFFPKTQASASCARVTSCLQASFALSILSQAVLPSQLMPPLRPETRCSNTHHWCGRGSYTADIICL